MLRFFTVCLRPTVWICLCFLHVAFCVSARAEPVQYDLDLEQTKVAFFFTVGGRETRGTFPIERATVQISRERMEHSFLDVTLLARNVSAKGAVISRALRGKQFLDVHTFEKAHFTSRRVVPTADGAKIAGDLTLKGVKRPLTLTAVFKWSSGYDALRVDMSGKLNRHDFGVSGFPALVGNTIALKFQVYLKKQ